MKGLLPTKIILINTSAYKVFCECEQISILNKNYKVILSFHG